MNKLDLLEKVALSVKNRDENCNWITFHEMANATVVLELIDMIKEAEFIMAFEANKHCANYTEKWKEVLNKFKEKK